MASGKTYLNFTTSKASFCKRRPKLLFDAKIVTLALDAGLRESVLLGGRGGVLDLFFNLFNRANVLRWDSGILHHHYQKGSSSIFMNCASCDEVGLPILATNFD